MTATVGAPPLLEVSGLGVELNGLTILSDVALTVAHGGSIGLVGETGSGKSITCRALLGLLGRVGGRVERGSIVFDGMSLADADERTWRRMRGRRIAFVPQASLNSLDPVMSVGRQLRGTLRAIDPDTDTHGRAVDLLEMVHLNRPQVVMKQYAHQLSGGMRQRVAIALALAGSPDLLIADEPPTALEVTVQSRILDLFVELRAATGMALLIVTHDLGVVARVAESLAVMYAGTVVESGDTQRVLADPLHPYTRALLGTLPSARKPGERLVSVRGRPPSPGSWPPGCRFAPRCPHATELCATVPDRISVRGRSVACTLYLAEDRS